MHVIQTPNLGFMFYPLIKIILTILGSATVVAFLYRTLFKWLPKEIYNGLLNIVLGLAAVGGLYIGIKLFIS